MRVGDGVTEAIDMGYFEGYRKAMCVKEGRVYISAGCRYFTLAEAFLHWADQENRPITKAMLNFARDIAKLKGWKEE